LISFFSFFSLFSVLQAERLAYFEEGKQPQLTGDAHVQDLVASLRWADSLVITYPTWWFNLPASTNRHKHTKGRKKNQKILKKVN
jgi:hypothetical protein